MNERRLCDPTVAPQPDAEIRVVLVKPGDVLLIGNIGEMEPDAATEVARQFRDLTGLRVVLFENDIDIDLWTSVRDDA